MRKADSITITIVVRKSIIGHLLLNKPIQYIWYLLIRLRIVSPEWFDGFVGKCIKYKVGDSDWKPLRMLH